MQFILGLAIGFSASGYYYNSQLDPILVIIDDCEKNLQRDQSCKLVAIPPK